MLVDIAKICAEQDSDHTAMYIQDFGIEDEGELVRIAKICAKQKNANTAKHIHKFCIKQKGALNDVAKLCAEQNIRTTIRSIANFGIDDPETVVEIAKFCARKNSEVTARNIKKFGIKDERALIEIAKICAQQEGGNAASNIDYFNIKDEKALVEMVELCMQQNVVSTAFNINKFHIKDQKLLVKIAMESAKQNGKATASCIERFHILSELDRRQIFIECIKENLEASYYLEKFDLGEEDTRLLNQGFVYGARREISNIVKWSDLSQIKNEYQVVLAFILKDVARRNAEGVVSNIDKISLDLQEELVSIALACAEKNGEYTARFINKFHIESDLDRQRIFIECIINNKDALVHLEKFELKGAYFQLLLKIFSLEGAISREGLVQAVELLSYQQDHKDYLISQLDDIMKIKDEYVREGLLKWYFSSVTYMGSLDHNSRNWILNSPLWRSLVDLRSHFIRERLIKDLFHLSANQQEKGEFWKEKLRDAKPIHLAMLPLIGLEEQGVSRSTLEDIFNFLSSSKWKDKVLTVDVIKALYELANEPRLGRYQKEPAINRVFYDNQNNLLDQERVVKNIKAAHGLVKIGSVDWIVSDQTPDYIFREKLESVIPRDDFKGDLIEGYERVFLKSRHPNGLLQYAIGIKSLRNAKASDSLGRFVRSVLEGTFKAERYRKETHPHLAKVFGDFPDLEDAWKKCMVLPLDELVDGGNSKPLQNWPQWIEQKLFVDRHLGEIDLGFLEKYLAAPSENKDRIFKGLGQAMSKRAKELKKGGQDIKTDPLYLALRLQKSCINLIRDVKNTDLSKLEDLKNLAPLDSEFYHDVSGMVEAFSQQSSYAGKLTVEITDDPLDLLYSGSDVDGSCQRLSGSPELNKGLLGTLEDGKVQLLAIKAPNGKIIARSLLKLMWDGEKPVLYQERAYISGLDQNYEKVLDAAARKRADALGLPLAGPSSAGNHPIMLQSLGGPAPFEYSDAVRGVQEDGVYSHSASLIPYQDK